MTLVENPSTYPMPRATRFLILDDLTSENPNTALLLGELRNLVDSKDKAMLISSLTLSKRLKKEYEKSLIKNKSNSIQFAFGIGNAGEAVAQKLDLRVPVIKLSPTRINTKNGGVRIVSKESESLFQEIKNKIQDIPENLTEIGIIDDTVFSGETLKAVIFELKKFFPQQNITALTLTYLPHLAKEQLNNQDVKVIAGMTLRSSKEKQNGINSIDAKDFVDESALPLSDGTSLPFMNEENWMRSWFGNNYNKAMEVCSRLKNLQIY